MDGVGAVAGEVGDEGVIEMPGGAVERGGELNGLSGVLTSEVEFATMGEANGLEAVEVVADVGAGQGAVDAGFGGGEVALLIDVEFGTAAESGEGVGEAAYHAGDEGVEVGPGGEDMEGHGGEGNEEKEGQEETTTVQARGVGGGDEEGQEGEGEPEGGEIGEAVCDGLCGEADEAGGGEEEKGKEEKPECNGRGLVAGTPGQEGEAEEEDHGEGDDGEVDGEVRVKRGEAEGEDGLEEVEGVVEGEGEEALG